MIHSVSGIVAQVNDTSIVVQTGLFGITLAVPIAAQFTKNQQVVLFAHLAWHQEQGPSLYGFSSELERTIFLLLISCNGIGPRLGLAIVSELPPALCIQAIMTADYKALSRVSGVGTKKAEQIVLSLKDKVAKLVDSGLEMPQELGAQNWRNLADVLQSLNYSRSEINGALEYVRVKAPGEQSFDQSVRKALSFLAKKV